MAHNENGVVTLIAGEVLEPYRRVKLSSSTSRTIVYADAGEEAIGVTRAEAAAIGDIVAVDLWNRSGTFEIETAGAVACNASVYGADDGKIDDTASGLYLGKAMAAAAAATEVIEVLQTPSEFAQAAHVADPAAITLADITDNSGGVDPADDTIAAITEAATITDSSGGADPGDDTIAAITEAATITDSSGGVDPGDDTIAAVTNIDLLVDSTGGAADDTVGPLVPVSDTSMVAINGSGMTTAQEAEYDAAIGEINAAVGVANDNFKELTDQAITQRTANTAITAAVAQIAAKVNINSLAVDAASDAVAQLAAKVNVNSLAVDSASDAIAQLAAKMDLIGDDLAVIRTKQIAIITAFETAGLMATS